MACPSLVSLFQFYSISSVDACDCPVVDENGCRECFFACPVFGPEGGDGCCEKSLLRPHDFLHHCMLTLCKWHVVSPINNVHYDMPTLSQVHLCTLSDFTPYSHKTHKYIQHQGKKRISTKEGRGKVETCIYIHAEFGWQIRRKFSASFRVCSFEMKISSAYCVFCWQIGNGSQADVGLKVVVQTAPQYWQVSAEQSGCVSLRDMGQFLQQSLTGSSVQHIKNTELTIPDSIKEIFLFYHRRKGSQGVQEK